MKYPVIGKDTKETGWKFYLHVRKNSYSRSIRLKILLRKWTDKPKSDLVLSNHDTLINLFPKNLDDGQGSFPAQIVQLCYSSKKRNKTF